MVLGVPSNKIDSRYNYKNNHKEESNYELSKLKKLTQLEKDTTSIMKGLESEFREKGFYEVFSKCIKSKHNDKLKKFLTKSISDELTLQNKKKTYFSIVKTALKTASEFKCDAQTLYHCTYFNYIDSLIKAGLNLNLQKKEISFLLNKLQESSIQSNLIKKLSVGLMFTKIFEKDDLIFGIYSKNKYYAEGGCAEYRNSIMNFCPEKANKSNPCVVVDIGKTIYQSNQKKLEMSPKLKQIYNYFLKHPNKKNKPLIDYKDISNWKRVSKGMLQFALDKSIKVHFILDNIDSKTVTSKKTNSDGSHLFTGSELRYLYRQWLKKPKLIEDNIIFWQNGKRVIAPWKQEPKLWKQYK